MTPIERFLSNVKLRPWQIAARDKLVQLFKNGHKNQMLMCPTGGGKTILAMYLIAECLSKGKRAVFIADRRVLIFQTAAVAKSIGICEYSIFMADDPRYDPDSRFQIASVQTIAQRGWPEADLYIIDEAHTMMKAWTDKINSHPGAFIGLSATPFGALKKYFGSIVNAAAF